MRSYKEVVDYLDAHVSKLRCEDCEAVEEVAEEVVEVVEEEAKEE